MFFISQSYTTAITVPNAMLKVEYSLYYVYDSRSSCLNYQHLDIRTHGYINICLHKTYTILTQKPKGLHHIFIGSRHFADAAVDPHNDRCNEESTIPRLCLSLIPMQHHMSLNIAHISRLIIIQPSNQQHTSTSHIRKSGPYTFT